MKLIEMKCKNCGATLNVEENAEKIVCNNEVQHVQYDNMSNSGYEFEKGRIRAQREEQERLAAEQREEQLRWKKQQEAQNAIDYARRTYGNNSNSTPQNYNYNGEGRNKWVALFLCLFLGYFGVHKFYEGKVVMGIVYLFTFGLFGIGLIVDIISILSKPTIYYT